MADTNSAKGKSSRGVSWQAVVIGVILIPLNALWVQSAELLWKSAWGDKGTALGPNLRIVQQRLVSRLVKRTDIDEEVTPYILQCGHATRLLDRDFAIRGVQEKLKYANVSRAMVYTYVNPAALRAKLPGNSSQHTSPVQTPSILLSPTTHIPRPTKGNL